MQSFLDKGAFGVHPKMEGSLSLAELDRRTAPGRLTPSQQLKVVSLGHAGLSLAKIASQTYVKAVGVSRALRRTSMQTWTLTLGSE